MKEYINDTLWWVKNNFWYRPTRRIKLLVKLFPSIWNYYDWDYAYSFLLFSKSLEILGKGIRDRDIHEGAKETGEEIIRTSKLIKRLIEDDYYNEAGRDFDKSVELQKKDQIELLKLVKNYESWWD